MQTVIAAFQSRTAAQAAMDALRAQGVPTERVHLQARDEGAGDYGGGTTSTREDSDSGFIAKVGDFFGHLFGADDEDSADSRRYTEAVRQGSAVVTVDAETEAEADEACRALEGLGALDVEEQGYGTQLPGDAMSTASAETSAPEGAQAIPVIEEELKVGKRRMQAGRVRVVGRVTETPVQEQVRLQEERARVERRPADRSATPADLEAFREQTFEIQETTEEPVLEKRAHVVEEVLVGKDVRERTETVGDTVRRTDVEIERDGERLRAEGEEMRGDAPSTSPGTSRSSTTARPRGDGY